MDTKIIIDAESEKLPETLSSFIRKDCKSKISHKALFVGFKHRIKVEYLKSFVV